MHLHPISRHVLASSLVVCTCIQSRSSRAVAAVTVVAVGSSTFLTFRLLASGRCSVARHVPASSPAAAGAVVTEVTVVAVESSRLLAFSLPASSVVSSSRLAVSILASSLCASNLFASSLLTPLFFAPTLLASSPLASSLLASSLLCGFVHGTIMALGKGASIRFQD